MNYHHHHELVVAVLALLAATLLLQMNETDACTDCPIGLSFCDHYEQAAVVLRGTVLNRTEVSDTNDYTVYEIVTTELFKGDTDSEYAVGSSFNATTKVNSDLCVVSPEIGVDYVFGFQMIELVNGIQLVFSMCDLVQWWASLTDLEEELLRAGCDDDLDPCEKCNSNEVCLEIWLGFDKYYICQGTPSPTPSPCACEEFQECLFYAAEDDDEGHYYCADVCAPGRCGDEETCSLEEDTSCTTGPCPPVAQCFTAPPYAVDTTPSTYSSSTAPTSRMN